MSSKFSVATDKRPKNDRYIKPRISEVRSKPTGTTISAKEGTGRTIGTVTSEGAVELKSKGRLLVADAFHNNNVPGVVVGSSSERATPQGLVRSPRPGASVVASPVPASPRKNERSPPRIRSPPPPPVIVREAVEAEKETRVAVAESVAANQNLLDRMVERRQRSEQLTQLYRDETKETALELAQSENDLRDLQARRRDLVQLSRTLELQLYQHRKQNPVQNAKKSEKSTTLEYRSTTEVDGDRSSHATAASSSRVLYQELNRRMDAAKSITQQLQQEIDKCKTLIAERSQERTTIASYVNDLRVEVAQLEQHEIFVKGSVRESKHVIQHAGTLAARIPHLERVIQELSASEKAIRSDFAETQKHLMAFIHEDDITIDHLRSIVQSRNGSSGALPSLVRQLQVENDIFQRFTHTFLEKSESERIELQRSTDNMQARLHDMEVKIRAVDVSNDAHSRLALQ